MPFAVSKTWVNNEVITHTDLNTAFDEVENVINGSLTSANLNSAAGITNAQLANPHYEFTFKHYLLGPDLLAAGVTRAIGAAIPIGTVPYDGVTANYVLTGIQHCLCNQTAVGGITNAQFNLFYCTAAQITAGTGTQMNAATIDVGSTTAVYNIAVQNATFSVSNSYSFFILRTVQVGVAYTAATPWALTLKFRREGGLRSA